MPIIDEKEYLGADVLTNSPGGGLPTNPDAGSDDRGPTETDEMPI